MAFYHK